VGGAALNPEAQNRTYGVARSFSGGAAMPRLVHSTPKYSKHKASGQAVVTIDARDVYLGPHGTAASRREYDRVISEWLARGRRRAVEDEKADLRIVELVAAFWKHAQGYYSADHPGELGSFKVLLKLLKRLYGDTLIAEFGPQQLKALRHAMIKADWARKYINRQVVRLRQVFKWGVSERMVSGDVLFELKSVPGLKTGRTEARESEPVKPVADHLVEGALEFLSPTVRAMVRLQLVTGMRPGEMCAMRTGNIDTTGELWLYQPAKHKTQHHGHQRLIFLGPKAKAILGPLLRPDLQLPIFSPAESEAWHRERRAGERTTPESCGNAAGTNRRRRPGRKPGKRFKVDAYRRAIEYACDRAFPPPEELGRIRVAGRRGKDDLRWETVKDHRTRLGEEKWAALLAWRQAHRWHPHQLRHNAGTALRKRYGLEGAQVILGHKSLAVTEIYAEKNIAEAQRIMSEVG
jgi:integrase